MEAALGCAVAAAIFRTTSRPCSQVACPSSLRSATSRITTDKAQIPVFALVRAAGFFGENSAPVKKIP